MSPSRFIPRLVLLITLLASTVLPASAALPPSPSTPPLFGDPLSGNDDGVGPGERSLFLPPPASLPWASPLLDEPALLRARPIAIDWPLLEASLALGARLPLNLFDDAAPVALLDRLEAGYNGGFIWQGHLEGVPMSHVLLVANQGVLIGKVAWPGAVYTLRYVGQGLHELAQVEQTALPAEGAPVAVELPAVALAPAGPEGADDGAIIDLLVAYTADARAAAGGTTAMENEIKLEVAESNLAYANSQVTQRFHLVYAGEVVYTETGDASTDLSRLRAQGDGYMDEVHTWRNTYHADTVSLTTQTGGCGLGYMQTTISLSFESWAFNVGNRSCFTGNMTLPHEQGHNMGIQHDWYMSSSQSPFPYAHGYAYPPGQWRTVMAYNDLCAALSTSCTRLPYFSNPNVLYNGVPMGVASGGPTNCVAGSTSPNPTTCAADARLTLNNSGPTVAQFRASLNTWTGAVSADWFNAANWTMLEGAPGATYTVQRTPRAIDRVYIPAAPTGGRFPTIASGTALAYDVTLAGGAQLAMTGGALEVYGQWTESGAATFIGEAGSVTFKGLLEQKVTTTGGSYFNDLVIGDGLTSQFVSAQSSLDVDGNLTIQSGASLAGGTYTHYFAGNFTDNGSSYTPDTSTAVFNGVTQNLYKPNTNQNLLTEPFEEGDGMTCCSTAYFPAGWTREGTWYGGDLNIGDGHGGILIQWNDVSDGWMFSQAFYLKPDVTYNTAYQYRNYGTGTKTFSLYIGASQSSASMTQLVSTVTSNTTTYTTQNGSFTVATAGYYHLGFRVQTTSGTAYALLDNVTLDAVADSLVFYNLQVANGATLIQNRNLKLKNNLTVDLGGTLRMNGFNATVEGLLANNGTLHQVLTVPTGGATRFFHILNAAGSVVKYEGVDITPATTTLGATTVTVRGNQTHCRFPDELIHRCYTIDPASAQTATVRFWYLDSERGVEEPTLMNAYHWNGSGWDLLTLAPTPRGGSAPYYWVESNSVSQYSPFALADGQTSMKIYIPLVVRTH
jgi:hypothetical protein